MQPLREFGPLHPGRAVTIDAAYGCERTRAVLDHGGIIQTSRWLLVRMAIDRSHANSNERPVYEVQVRSGPGDAIEAAEEKCRHSESSDNRERADGCQNSQLRLPRSLDFGAWEFARLNGAHVGFGE